MAIQQENHDKLLKQILKRRSEIYYCGIPEDRKPELKKIISDKEYYENLDGFLRQERRITQIVECRRQQMIDEGHYNGFTGKLFDEWETLFRNAN